MARNIVASWEGNVNRNSAPINKVFYDENVDIPLPNGGDSSNSSSQGADNSSASIPLPDNPSIWDRMQNFDSKLNNGVENFVKSHALTSFLAKAGQSAANTMTNGGALQDNYDTGSKLANGIADLIGTGVGFAERLPGTDFSVGNAMNKVIGEPVQNTLKDVATRYGANNKLADYTIQALKTGAEFGGYQGLSNASQGKDVKQGIAEGMGQGMLWGAGGKAVGDAFSHFVPGIGKTKVMGEDGNNVIIQDESGNTTPMNKAIFDNTAQNIPQQTIDNINSSNNLSGYSPRELLATRNQNNNIKNSMDNLGFNSNAVNNETINNELNSRLGANGGTTYTVKNTAKDQAIQEYQNAIDAIHNHFGTNKLMPEELARIKPELGIDIQKLLSNIDNAKTDVANIGDRQRLKQIAGIDNTSINPVTQTNAEQIPFVRTLRQPQQTEQIPSVVTYRKKIPVQNTPIKDTTHNVNDQVVLNNNGKIDAGTISKVNNDGTVEVQRPEGDYVLAKKDGDSYKTLYSEPTSKDQIAIDSRDTTNISDRNIKAYQYLHPELKSHIQDDAQAMLQDLKDTQRHEKYGINKSGTQSGWTDPRITSNDIKYLRDNVGMSYEKIQKGLEKLINDDGAENNADSKKIELVIDSRLNNGYTDFKTGYDVAPNKEYVTKKNGIEAQNVNQNKLPDFTMQNQSTPIWSGYDTKTIGDKPLDNKVSGYKTVTNENTFGIPQNTKYPNQKMPSLINPKKATENVNGKGNTNIPLGENTQQIPSISDMISKVTKAPDILNTDYSKVNDVNTLNDHISQLQDTIKNTKDESQLKAMNLQLFAAQAQLKKLTDVIRPNIDTPGSRIVSSKDTNKFNFKNALNNFYTKAVDINKPISDMSKISGDNAYIKSINSKNVGGVVDHILQNALVDRQGNKIGFSLKEIAKQIPKGKENQFWEYMLHKHNVQRAAEGKNVYSDYNSTASQNAVNQFEQLNPDLKKAGQNVTKFLNKFMSEWGNKSGLISDDLWNSLQKQYPNYIPTNRSFTELEGGISKTNGKGFVDQSTPLSRATGSSRDIINPVENIMNLVNRTVRTAKYNEVGQEILNSLRKDPQGLQKYAEIVPEGTEISPGVKNVVTVLENGNPVNIQINNKPLLDSLEGLNKNNVGTIEGIAKKVTTPFKSLITTKNPLFALRNISRDIPTYLVNSKENNPVKALWNLGGSAKDILTNSDTYNRYKAVGGGGSNFLNSEKPYKSAKELTHKGLLPMLSDGVESFNNVFESAPRLAEFKRTLKQTGDVNKALYDSSDVTTNFARGGNVTKSLDSFVPYLNAGVQGLDKVVRQFKDHPFVATAKGLATITAPTMAINYMNKDNKNYQALDNRTKDNYFLFPYGDGSKFIKIPKSRELGVAFGSLAERLVREHQGDKQAFKGFGNTVATNLAPSSPVENNILAPLIYNIPSNKDFAGRTIVPQSMQGRSPALQYDEKTSDVAKKIGELTNLSPKQIDYVIRSYTGVIGQFLQPLTTQSTSTGSKTSDLLSPLTSGFTADPLYNNQALQDFYDNMGKAKTDSTDNNFINNIAAKTKTDPKFLASEFTRANKQVADLTKQSFDALQKGDMDTVKQIRQKIIDIATNENKYIPLPGQDPNTIPTPSTELNSQIGTDLYKKRSSEAKTIRGDAKSIYNNYDLSAEEKTQQLQNLVNQAQNAPQKNAPKTRGRKKKTTN